ncbi:hypothetical protein IQ258_19645 [Coleofasciculus sp. LEGE 07081]|uniref:DNA methyltransferase n=1 Tax=Coleofasciculus sp. LEGE 07081 TaxID=2777967 RepID=UPI001882F16C|nr:DNA methyltransferase [Coleofasciculus sp. LEGE 07081]MBE9128317.1 hypothetical protein [Coleofasciculus sp. LEGE 07081]
MALTLTDISNEPTVADTQFDQRYNEMLRAYQISGAAQKVNFRTLIEVPGFPDRGTHLIHSYPAKLITHIPYFFLSCNRFFQMGTSVLDPFCGSGTVLLEALIQGKNAIGIDVNPLATEIAFSKTLNIDIEILKRILGNLKRELAVASSEHLPYPDVVNLQYWFRPELVPQINNLRSTLLRIENNDAKRFFLICFSSMLRKFSLADPSVSVPVKLKPSRFKKGTLKRKKSERFLFEQQFLDINEAFFEIAYANIRRLESVPFSKDTTCKIIQNDTRTYKLPACTADLIITSPPYAGAQKYIRSSSLNIGWLGLEASYRLKHLNKQSVGREAFSKAELRSFKPHNDPYLVQLVETLKTKNIVRAKLISEYFHDLNDSLENAITALKPGGYAIVIIGNTTACDQLIEIDRALKFIMKSLNADVELHLIDEIKSRGLITKRNKTAGIITQEHIIVFKKEATFDAV